MNKHIFLLSLLLAGCGSGEDNSSEAATGGAVIEDTPANLQEDPNNEVVPLTTPVMNVVGPTVQASPTPIAAVPADFRGRWGLVPADCVPGRDDVKGLMTVNGNSLSFYESRAQLKDLRQLGPGKIAATFAYSGEGQNWQRQGTLMLINDGLRLLREEQGGGQDEIGNGRYSRCPT